MMVVMVVVIMMVMRHGDMMRSHVAEICCGPPHLCILICHWIMMNLHIEVRDTCTVLKLRGEPPTHPGSRDLDTPDPPPIEVRDTCTVLILRGHPPTHPGYRARPRI